VGRFVIAGMLVVLGLSGCDYWPPSLQAQIEHLRSEAQAAASERVALETRLAEVTKAKDELQARLEGLTRQNHELTAHVTELEKTLAEREKALKAAKPAKKATPKTSRKASPKTSTRHR